ncbi:hypothetical protein RHSIM_Rhsim05G0041600 [Rhododendron simsii]|uniref:Exostosin GT47 domain-containing protein n=1 Tax=Rhododendron simsii TaxID=118357 RepID=A0A834H3X4_RHOSS|nr:hypothetical protein RHSIM_Rhsim05G0041600 [Rhododendron simsii]
MNRKSCSHCGKVLHHDEFTEEPTFVKGTGGEAPRLTRENMGNCIRALCNSNVAGGFRVGKDASLLVTYIRTSQDTQKDLGGKPPSDRHVMAFFAGGMHDIIVKSWSSFRVLVHKPVETQLCQLTFRLKILEPRRSSTDCFQLFSDPYFQLCLGDVSGYLRRKDDGCLGAVGQRSSSSVLKVQGTGEAAAAVIWRVGAAFSEILPNSIKKLEMVGGRVAAGGGSSGRGSIHSFCIGGSYKVSWLCHIEKRRWLFVVGLVAITHLFCQSLMLPYGTALLSLFPGDDLLARGIFLSGSSSVNSNVVRNSILSNVSNSVDATLITTLKKHNVGGEIGHSSEPMGDNRTMKNEFDLGMNDLKKISEHDNDTKGDDDSEDQNFVDLNDNYVVDHDLDYISVSEKANESRWILPLEQIVEHSDGTSEENIPEADGNVMPGKVRTINITSPVNLVSNGSIEIGSAASKKSSRGAEIRLLSRDGNHLKLQSGLGMSISTLTAVNKTMTKKMRCDMPPKSVMSIYEMNQLLVRHRRSSRAMRPRWSSVRDQEILAAKSQIENAPIAKNDGELYAPLFRNVSMFKRSYELMERTLKVYVYKDGEKPIFHQPILKGLYASEGWFMKLMEGNKQFVVKDPRRAHLFYMPFSSRMLEYTLYVRNSHNRTNLRQFLKQYSERIAAKYRFWNRTGGADHFLVACHDWAPYETRHHMEHCIKALCNADVTAGFKIGRDVSLPETYVRSARNPQRDLGGKPPSKRNIFAFYAGNIHGYLRPILLKYWKDKDPDMKILGPMPPGVASKMNYIQHMKSSKYCICPKGYEVNSPRVVESIFYECIPVIISDNFVPPFFGVLDWGSFSVILAEKDIPKLKDILLSIPEEKYLDMQLAVRKVQKHFLWHAKPLKYDLFHMTLHSIWYNRVFQIKPR